MHFNPMSFKVARILVRDILERPHWREWSVQGFGMLRTYLDDDKVWRLNLWHSGAAVRDVSTIHDHPWDFTSLVVAGQFINRRYVLSDGSDGGRQSVRLKRVRIQTGPGGGIRGEPSEVIMRPLTDEVYLPGDVYRQQAEEVHESLYRDGTVTINERIRRPDGEHANVFYPTSQSWNDAEPRPATKHEVDLYTREALELFPS